MDDRTSDYELMYHSRLALYRRMAETAEELAEALRGYVRPFEVALQTTDGGKALAHYEDLLRNSEIRIRYRKDAAGPYEALEKYDVTDQFDAILEDVGPQLKSVPLDLLIRCQEIIVSAVAEYGYREWLVTKADLARYLECEVSDGS